MTIRLRAHHLLCMLTFVGKGYTPAFVENYRAIARRLSAGETIEIVEGPDDICRPLVDRDGGDAGDAHCHRQSVIARDRLAADAVSALLGTAIVGGSIVAPDGALLDRLRTAFREESIRKACHGCEWAELCSQVAGEGFAGVLVGKAPVAGKGR